MTGKTVVPRAVARADVETAIDHYASEAGGEVANKFIDALEQAYAFIGDRPAAGSPRWSNVLNLPGLRTWRVKGFPWFVFYIEYDTHVDVWRVLHASRDIPAWMTEIDKE